jgi:uncharacterized membrane protein YkoI
MPRTRHLLLLAALLPALGLPVTAGSGDAVPPASDPAADFERALGAVARGEIRPLSEILPRIEQDFGGRAIETEIETDEGRWVYEFDILTADGRLFEVDVDAVTGETLEVEEEVD